MANIFGVTKNTDNNNIDIEGEKIAIVVANFYNDIAQKLLSGAVKTLKTHGVYDNDITIYYVPGAFEVPLIAKKLTTKTPKYSGIITLGAIIRGETPHFSFISAECVRGIAKVSYDTNIPVSFGILTTDNMAQALARAGGNKGNKGVESAMAVIEMIELIKK